MKQLEINIELWPSIEEINESTAENLYLGNLTEFYSSIKELYSELNENNIPFQRYRDLNYENGEKRHFARAFPPAIVEIIAWLSSSGVALSIYKVFKLWIKYKNGRKIKVTMDNLEVEATQLSEKNFMQLLERIQKYQESIIDKGHDFIVQKDKLKKQLKKDGYILRGIDEGDRTKEIISLKMGIRKNR